MTPGGDPGAGRGGDGTETDEQTILRLRRELDEAHRTIAGIQGSTAFRAAAAATRLAGRALPPGTERRRVAARLLRRDEAPATVARHPLEARTALSRLAALASTGAQGFVIAVLATPGGDVDATLGSLRAQTWTHWRAHVLHPAAGTVPNPAATERVTHHQDGTGAAALAAVLIPVPDREMVLVLDAGDTLVPQCLYEIAAALWRNPLVDLVTWDDQVGGGGLRPQLRLRPAWSPETLLSANYLDRSFALRAARIHLGTGPVSGSAAALIWDLLLRSELSADRVTRIPRSLGRAARSTPVPPTEAVKVVGRELERRGWAASARWTGGAVRVVWALPHWPRLSVVIPTRHNRDLIGPLLDGLARAGYPDLEVVVVDNGSRTDENERWYEGQRLRPTVLWWDRPFNYSAVNNAGAAAATGEVLLFLNDDIRVGTDPGWLRELVGWTSVDGIGSVGMQLIDPQGHIQHGGVILGLTGFAGHLFAGMRPGSSSLMGPTTWYRDVLAVTAACVAVRRSDLEAVGGFDEGFILCGSDVVLGLSLHDRGLRSLCLPSNALTHLESATRGSSVPREDYFTSWWRYQRWVRSGDPHFHPRLSVQSTAPRLRRRGEPGALELVSPHLGRTLGVWHSQEDLPQAGSLAARCRIEPAGVEAVRAGHRAAAAPAAPRTLNWYIPGIDSPFYGGINTALRIAAKLTRDNGIENRIVVCGGGPEEWVRSGITAAFPELARSPIIIAENDEELARVPAADAAIATLWSTAYQVARHRATSRKYYLVQDFEPMFYPAGTIYALAEESYRLGLYAICNTENLARIYRTYGGTATHFTPAVDTEVFHARGRVPSDPDAPVALFVYARPGHWRNCWELAEPALHELKERLGDRIRIIAAGSWAIPDPTGRMPSIDHLGLLDYAETGALYRRCDMGLALTVSEHPSYLPLELMACGAGVVAFDNPAGHWLLHDGVNCLLAPRTIDGLVDRLEAMAVDPALRRRLAGRALQDIAERHADWDAALSGIHDFLTDPEGVSAGRVPTGAGAGSHRARAATPSPTSHG
jgi:GT2 family glycosyltransferase/glycosyltransferase involved in cell wall biosynthesis